MVKSLDGQFVNEVCNITFGYERPTLCQSSVSGKVCNAVSFI